MHKIIMMWVMGMICFPALATAQTMARAHNEAADSGTLHTGYAGPQNPNAPSAPLPAKTFRSVKENAIVGAHWLREENRGKEVLPNKEGIMVLDHFINRNRKWWDNPTKQHSIQVLGCFLGEAIIKAYGGTWIAVGDESAIQMANGNRIFPITQVEKHIDSGDSIAGFFESLAGTAKTH